MQVTQWKKELGASECVKRAEQASNTAQKRVGKCLSGWGKGEARDAVEGKEN